MSDHTGICITWPVYYDGCTDPEAHVTAVFLGNTDTATFKREMVQDIVAQLGPLPPGKFQVTGTAMFGKDNDVPVLLIGKGQFELHYDVSLLKRLLTRHGIPYSDLFGFNAHVTVPDMSNVPKYVNLSAPVVWWGNERALHPEHVKREKAIDAAVNALWAEDGSEPDREYIRIAVQAALHSVG